MLRARRRQEVPERLPRPGRGWVIAVYLIGLVDLVAGLFWAANVWGTSPEDIGFGIIVDPSGFAFVILLGTFISSALLFAFAAVIDLAGRSVLAAEEASARVAALEAAIDDLIDVTPTPAAVRAAEPSADRLEPTV